MDLLRFLLAFFVMCFHYFFFSHYAYNVSSLSPNFVNNFSIYGRLGVQIFFVLSGFVILYTAHNKKVLDFLFFRISRLLPGIMIVSVIGYLSYLFLPSPEGLLVVNLRNFLMNFTGLSVSPFDYNMGSFIDGSMWSLRYELGFYFLVSLLIFVKHLKYLSYYVWGWLTFSFIKISLYPDFFNILPEQLIGNRFTPFFSIGILVYLLKLKVDPKNRLINIVALALTIPYSVYCVFVTTEFGNPIVASFLYVTGLFVFLLTLFFNPKDREIYGILGGSSYVLYLIHQNLGYRIMLYFGDWHWYKSILLMCAMILFAIVLHVFLEKKMIDLFKKLLLRLKFR